MTSDDRMRSRPEQGCIVAFYGLAADGDAVGRFYDEIVCYLRSQNCPPNKLAISGEGLSGELRTFAGMDSRVRKTGFAKVTSFEMYSMWPDDESLSTGWKSEVGVNITSSYAIVALHSSVLYLEQMFPISVAAVSRLRPCYGIGYRRDMRLGPSLYPLGMNFGLPTLHSGPEYQEQLRVSRWGHTAMGERLFEEGLLRDLYPYNFLTQPHLDRRVAGVPLKDWIALDCTHGWLEPFEGDVWLWSVDDTVRPYLREILIAEGVIFHAERYWPRPAEWQIFDGPKQDPAS